MNVSLIVSNMSVIRLLNGDVKRAQSPVACPTRVSDINIATVSDRGARSTPDLLS